MGTERRLGGVSTIIQLYSFFRFLHSQSSFCRWISNSEDVIVNVPFIGFRNNLDLKAEISIQDEGNRTLAGRPVRKSNWSQGAFSYLDFRCDLASLVSLKTDNEWIASYQIRVNMST